MRGMTLRVAAEFLASGESTGARAPVLPACPWCGGERYMAHEHAKCRQCGAMLGTRIVLTSTGPKLLTPPERPCPT